MSHIFISYSSTNYDYARKLADHLLRKGFDVWIDDDKLTHGDDWERVIFQAVETCAAFIVIMSPEAYSSPWVKREYHHAEKCAKPSFPILIAGEVFPWYATHQCLIALDRRMPPSAFLDRLAECVPYYNRVGRDLRKDWQQAWISNPAQDIQPQDISNLVKSFFVAYASGQLEVALELLLRMRLSAQVPMGVDLSFYEGMIWRKIQQSQEIVTTPAVSPVEELITILESHDSTPQERADAGLRLAEQGDPRPGVGVVKRGSKYIPDISWIEIPGGHFIYQGVRTQLPGYYIARYPITVAQYAAFVEDQGYTNLRLWDHQGLLCIGPRTAPLRWQDEYWHIANHPIVGVTWFEAKVFCLWLAVQLGFEVSLPTEQQWEKAAGSPYLYPWGDRYEPGYANVNEQGQDIPEGIYLGRTTAVGAFPQGVSPYGLYDMSGNVWEWCLNTYERYDPLISARTRSFIGSNDRTLRGGSWAFASNFGTVGVRIGYDPFRGTDDIGFRVVATRIS